jgi:hypothetical protein
MKKLIILSAMALLSGCACFDCEDDGQTLFESRRVAVQPQPKQEVKQINCDYFDGKTCYRYVYKNVEQPVAAPAPIRQRPCNGYQPQPQPVAAPAPVAPCGCPNAHATQNGQVSGTGCNCPDQISETREPVEVVYKKTTNRTVYEPKTYSQVSYESAPYGSTTVAAPAPMPAPAPVEVVPSNPQVVLEEVK